MCCEVTTAIEIAVQVKRLERLPSSMATYNVSYQGCKSH